MVDFLKDQQQLDNPVIVSRVISFYPLRIMDDDRNYLELGYLNENIGNGYLKENPFNYHLVLKDWNFVFKKIPNRSEFFFDVVSDNFAIKKAYNSKKCFRMDT